MAVGSLQFVCDFAVLYFKDMWTIPGHSAASLVISLISYIVWVPLYERKTYDLQRVEMEYKAQISEILHRYVKFY